MRCIEKIFPLFRVYKWVTAWMFYHLLSFFESMVLVRMVP